MVSSAVINTSSTLSTTPTRVAQTATTGVINEPSFTMPDGSPRQVSQVSMGQPVGYVGGQPGANVGNPPANDVRTVLERGNRVITSYPPGEVT